MKNLFLGIDVGTTAIKFGVIEQGKLLFKTSVPVTTYYEDKQKYQKAEEILASIADGVRVIPHSLRKELQYIGFSTAMHSCLPVVEETYDRIFIWSDNQAEETIEAFRETPEAKRFYQKTGTPIHAMSPFAKILHFQETGEYPPETVYYGLKELVLQQFVGEFLIDRSTASATGLFHSQELVWDQEILHFLGITEKQLAKVVEPTESFPILSSLAKELALPKNIKVLAGASDGCLAAYASYLTTGIPDSLTIGTSAAIRRITQTPYVDSEKQNFCYYLNEEFYVVGAPSNNGGCVLEWAKNQLFADEKLLEQLTMIQESPIGGNGIRFHPYINGERAPYWRNDQTAELKYLSIHHTKADILRGIIEGTLMNLKLLAKTVGIGTKLSISGGFFKTEILQQLTAEILAADCWLADANEPIFGLYYLLYPEEVKPAKMKKISGDEAAKQQYEQIYPTYFE
ncbi:gluconokinase [Enterococcus massiliensis]|uniref:gluconokinase n=1 Tax=Enterococcus massiliensis TaxID=1640685 RepID=UPI00065E40B4|nr:FGGY family carbohydrate kinase [Enterococcus massiliensis]